MRKSPKVERRPIHKTRERHTPFDGYMYLCYEIRVKGTRNTSLRLAIRRRAGAAELRLIYGDGRTPRFLELFNWFGETSELPAMEAKMIPELYDSDTRDIEIPRMLRAKGFSK